MNSTRSRTFILFLFFLFFPLCWNGFSAGLGEVSRKMLAIEQSVGKADNHDVADGLLVELEESKDGVSVSVRLNPPEKKSVPAGSADHIQKEQNEPKGKELSLLLDGNSLVNKLILSDEVDFKTRIDPMHLSDGDHVLECELNVITGKKYRKELKFSVNASPVVGIEPGVDKDGRYDPVIDISFFRFSSDHAGYATVYLDETFLGEIRFAKDESHVRKPLSQLVSKPADIFSLPQGTHLLAIEAHGMNGAETIFFHSFEINETPKVTVESDKKGKFQAVTVSFPKVDNMYSSSLDVYLNHGVIITERAMENRITIDRKKIEKAFEQHKFKATKTPVSLTVRARSANASETWKQLDFQ